MGVALVWRGGSPPCVRTANDGALQAGKKGNSMAVRHRVVLLNYSYRELAG